MARMRIVTERIEDPNLESRQRLQRPFGKITYIGRIGEAAEAEAERLAGAVDLPERQRFDRAPGTLDADRFAGADLMTLEDRRVFACGRRVETIGETRAELPARHGIVVDIDAAVAVIGDLAQIVDAVGVIGVVVGVEHAVEPDRAGIEELLAQIGRGIDQRRGLTLRAVPFDEERATLAPVLGIGGIACAPMIADAGHAAGRAAAENGE